MSIMIPQHKHSNGAIQGRFDTEMITIEMYECVMIEQAVMLLHGISWYQYLLLSINSPAHMCSKMILP
jgi:hypothetical protein